MKKKQISGTKEWSVESVNCVIGCSHDCRYCYAREMAERYKRVEPGDWTTMRVRAASVLKKHPKYDGTVMFPTTHDITPEVLDPCLDVIHRLLEARNKILIVTKPHYECVREICARFEGFASLILFRFTIGSCRDEVLKYWEPGAPPFAERLHSLVHAKAAGFDTSVSTEPLLDTDRLFVLGELILPHVTDSWWIGKMNDVRRRVKVVTAQDISMVSEIHKINEESSIRKVYDRYKNNPKIRWKESIKKVVGIELAKKAGEDK